jgi:type II secretory pathway component PulJ
MNIRFKNSFTLVELIISIALLSIIWVNAGRVFSFNSRAWETTRKRVDMVMNAQRILNSVRADIRLAGDSVTDTKLTDNGDAWTLVVDTGTVIYGVQNSNGVNLLLRDGLTVGTCLKALEVTKNGDRVNISVTTEKGRGLFTPQAEYTLNSVIRPRN